MNLNFNKKVLLKEYNEKSIQRGNVLICGDSNIQQCVYLMLCEITGTRLYELLIITGYKAGLSYVQFPEESLLEEDAGISTRWLINNWENWGYIESALENVFISEEPTCP